MRCSHRRASATSSSRSPAAPSAAALASAASLFACSAVAAAVAAAFFASASCVFSPVSSARKVLLDSCTTLRCSTLAIREAYFSSPSAVPRVPSWFSSSVKVARAASA